MEGLFGGGSSPTIREAMLDRAVAGFDQLHGGGLFHEGPQLNIITPSGKQGENHKGGEF